MARIIIVEDQRMLLDSLSAAIDQENDFEVIAKLTDAADVDAACHRLHPDIVLMDVCTEHGSCGIDAARILVREHPKVIVVIMTAMPDVSFISRARDAGVHSFVYKNLSTAELVGVLRSAIEGYTTFPHEPTMPLLGFNRLTEREIKILRLVCSGCSRAEIADQLCLSENTIKANISSVLTKTGFSSIAKLAIYAISSGFIAPNQPVG